MDRQTQRAEIEKLFQNSFPRPTPPKDFNTETASDNELIKYGYLPRPPDSAPPKVKELWKHVTSLPFKIVEPQLSVVDTPFISQKVADESHAHSPGWVGAIMPPTSSNETFFQVMAEWNVPTVGPHWEILNIGKDHQGTSKDSIQAWVGWQSPQPDDPPDPWIPPFNSGAVIGTSSFCIVTNGQIIDQGAKAWIQWRETISLVNGLSVYPGDVVCGVVTNLQVSLDPHGPPDTGTWVTMYNKTRGTTTGLIRLPGVALKGSTAQWLVGHEPYLSYGNLGRADPRHGPVVFSNILAVTADKTTGQLNSTNVDLSSATVLDKEFLGTVYSVARQIDSQSLQITQLSDCVIL